MANVGRITRRTMGAAVAALLGAAVPAGAASAHPGAPWHHRFHGVAGTVSAVNGSSTPGSCGTAGSAGSFTVTKHQASDTVDVATTTAFFERGVSSPSFANVCVGDLAGAIGMLSGTMLDANDVFVAPPPPRAVFGTVSAVNGSSTPGSCGTAGSAGSFTVTKHQASHTVDVATTTAFFERGVSSPSFANVCVGDLGGAIGMLSGTTLDANDVFVAPPPTPPSTESAPALDTWHGPAKQASVHTDSATLPHPGTPRPDNGQWSGTGRGLSQGRDTWRQGLSASHAWGGSNGRPWGGSNGDHGRR